jgi:hypothetical protein
MAGYWSVRASSVLASLVLLLAIVLYQAVDTDGYAIFLFYWEYLGIFKWFSEKNPMSRGMLSVEVQLSVLRKACWLSNIPEHFLTHNIFLSINHCYIDRDLL